MDISRFLKRSRERSVLNGLCADSFFPEVCPPPFTSRSFADLVEQESEINPFGTIESCRSVRSTQKSDYSFARPGARRRNFSIVNPVPFVWLCREIAENWDHLHSLSNSAPAGSSPSYKPDPTSLTAFQPPFNSVVKRERRAAIRANASYLVSADVAKFYPSIYTHAVAWAINGRDVIKRAKWDKELLGNRIDDALMAMQERQTIGVPIGQDCFRILAEILLTRVDTQVGATEKFYYRYSDDVEAAFATYSEAESFLSNLTYSLHEYGQSVNERKTRIVELPLPLEEEWITQQRPLRVERDGEVTAELQRAQLMTLFDTAFRLHKEYRGAPTISYALGMVPEDNYAIPRLHSENIDQVISLITHSATVEPSCFARSLRLLAGVARRRPEVAQDERVLKLVAMHIARGVQLGHSSELAWGLWAVLMFDMPIGQDGDLTAKLFDTGDQTSKVLCLETAKRGLFGDLGVISEWIDSTVKQEQPMLEKDWLTIYQVAFWEMGVLAEKTVKENAHFRYLLDNGISFFETSRDLKRMTCDYHKGQKGTGYY